MAEITTNVLVRLDYDLISAMLIDVTELSSGRAARRVADRANGNVRTANRVRTGALSKSYAARQSRNAMGQYARGFEVSSSLEYNTWQEEGIGPVVPVRAQVLRFQPKGSSVFIFRPRTRGFPGAHQLRNAYRTLSLQDYMP